MMDRNVTELLRLLIHDEPNQEVGGLVRLSFNQSINQWVSQFANKSWKFGFIKGVDKGQITTLKDLESWRFKH